MDHRREGGGAVNDWCDHHDCGHPDKTYYKNVDKNYYYYYNNGYSSNNHATVILQLDYSNSNNYHDIGLVVSNDFYSKIDFSGKPENLVLSNLDINQGQVFDVCLENAHDGKTNCEFGKLYDENKAVYIDMRVP